MISSRNFAGRTFGLARSTAVGRSELIALAAFLMFAFTAGLCMAQNDFPKLAPFTKVDFEEDKILVEFDGQTWQWINLDDIHVKKIVESAKTQFSSSWRKRIGEDLVEALDGLGHKPGSTVKLGLLKYGDKKARIIEKAPMTEANRRAVRSGNAETRDPVGEFHNQLKQRWAYYDASHNEIATAAKKLKEKLADKSIKTDLTLELNKLLSKGIDGHAGVSGLRLEGRCLPFLIDGIEERFIAFSANRKSLVDAKHPFIESIDGVSISDWCSASSELVAMGSKQLVQQRSLRNLRHIDHWRNQLGIPIKQKLTIKLASVDGTSTITKQLSTVDRKPIYGSWPRSESRKLDSNIGYLRIDSMDDVAVTLIKKYMPQFKDTRGLVVDVRGNSGGSRDALRWLFSFMMAPNDEPRVGNVAKYRLYKEFSDSHLEARFMYHANSKHWTESERKAIQKHLQEFQPEWEPPKEKFSKWHFLVLNRLNDDVIYHYDKPVVILCDVNCFSATDIFLAGLKGWRNVTLVGTPSSGGSARSVSFELPGVARARIASMVSYQPSGILYDGNGVSPDKIVFPDPEFFVGGKDKVLEKAIQIIGSH